MKDWLLLKEKKRSKGGVSAAGPMRFLPIAFVCPPSSIHLLFAQLMVIQPTQPFFYANVPIVFVQGDWDVYSFHINSTVTSRYATTVITSRVVNRMDESKEIEFHVRIPKNAFISKFKMCVRKD